MIYLAFLFLLIGLLAWFVVLLANGNATAPGDRLKYKWVFVTPLLISAMLFAIWWLS